MIDVLVTMRFDDSQLARLRAVSPRLSVRREDAGEADYSGAEILYAGSPPRDLERAPKLKWVQLHLAGVDAIVDHPVYAKSAVPLTTTSGVHAATIAEYAVTALLALCHRVPRMVEWKGRGGWPPDADRWSLFVPSEVRGTTLGIIGYGSIGRELARMAKSAFGMRVVALSRDPSRRLDEGYCPAGTGDPDGSLPDEWLPRAGLMDLLERSDVVVKPSAYFINVGRGATVDEGALAGALRDGRLAGAAIDVFAQEPPSKGHPFYALDNVILSPHVSGFLPSYDERCSELFAENLRRYLDGAPLLNLVDRAKGY
jgi:phosphoglycerate dehydrogenase-like enzyme